MNSNHSIIPLCVALALLLGGALSPLDRSIAERLGQRSEMESLRNIDAHFGQGLSVAILGGYRSVAANLVWLSMNRNWERRDIAGTLGKIALATSIDPRPELFWLNGARIIANDMPTWVVGLEQSDLLVETAEGRVVAGQFADRALALLEGSRPHHGENPNIYVEEAMILWRKAEDFERAADRFERALDTDDPPYHVFRVYAELLVKLGRKREALRLLESHFETLPDGSIEAMKGVVADRIRNLKEELGEPF